LGELEVGSGGLDGQEDAVVGAPGDGDRYVGDVAGEGDAAAGVGGDAVESYAVAEGAGLGDDGFGGAEGWAVVDGAGQDAAAGGGAGQAVDGGFRRTAGDAAEVGEQAEGPAVLAG
jgi:hypothetical protein